VEKRILKFYLFSAILSVSMSPCLFSPTIILVKNKGNKEREKQIE
jgi:hypothetical protein